MLLPIPHVRRGVIFAAVTAAVVSLIAPARTTAEAPTVARLNDLQVIGSHNSYKLAIDRPLLSLMRTFNAKADELDYAHASLTEQLDLGLRALEIDIYHDPEGGLFASPMGLEMVRNLGATPAPFDADAMRTPGFKVLHVADVDFRSSQPTLDAVLDELSAWSTANGGHLPVIVTMNLKDDKAPIPNGAEPLPFDGAALDALDLAIRSRLGDHRLITPDDVRGDHDTLEQAVLSGGWPALDAVRGRFLWAIDEGGAKRDAYLKDHPSLRGRALFTTPQPGAGDAALLIMNNPVKDEGRIRELVRLGYLVRTRADSGTREARSGDTRRLQAALRSGAQVISTDYYRPDPRFDAGYVVRLEDGSFARVRSPGAQPQPAAESH